RAWKFIEWVMSDVDANVERYLQGNCFTAFRPAWTDLRFNRTDDYFDMSLAGLLMELAPRAPKVVQSPHRAAFVNLFREKYWNALTTGGAKPEQVFSDLKAELLKGESNP